MYLIVLLYLFGSFFQMPQTEQEYEKIAEDFEIRWQFPHCVGAVDGKHIYIYPPANSGAAFRNYKGSFSIILLAIVDARYRFIGYDLGTNGRASDSGIWSRSEFKQALDNNKIRLPQPKPLVENDPETTVPYVFVGDDAFALSPYMMKPFRHNTPGQSDADRIFSYRLSRARRVVENAFGILSNRFRVLLNAINLDPEHVKIVVLACMALHNMLIELFAEEYTPEGYADTEDTLTGRVRAGAWRATGNALRSAGHGSSAGRHNHNAKRVRERFRRYFMTAGSVSWQQRMAGLE